MNRCGKTLQIQIKARNNRHLRTNKSLLWRIARFTEAILLSTLFQGQ